MADAIDEINTACYLAAKSRTLYDVWNKVAPSTVSGDCYVLVTASSGTSANAKQFRIERIGVTIGVYTKDANINADAIAGNIKDGIVDSTNTILIALDNPKMKVKYLNHTDNAPEAFVGQGATFINRFITLNFEVVTYS